jgi:5-methylthioadenosine/S-adenosylhomocysteine deaminase
LTSSLVRGRHVVCRAGSNGETEVIADGAVYQEDGVILEVGPYHDLAARWHPDEVLGGDDAVVMPGFVNAHHHLGVTPFQLGIPDLPLEMWIAARLAMRAVDPYLDTLYSAFEMIASGVTTVQHLHGHMFAPPESWAGTIDAILRAYKDVGMRVSFSAGIVEQDRLILEEADFLATLPDDLRDQVRAIPGSDRVPVEDQLAAAFVDVAARWGGPGHERIRIQLAPQNLHWCSDRALLAIKDASSRHSAGMHMHLVESPYQKVYAHRRSGRTAVSHLHDLGLLGPELTLGHAVWLSEGDIDLVAETQTFVCHNPSSNLRLRSGVAPVNQMLERGIRIAIGIDEAGINDDRDMLQEMRMALNLHRVPGLDSPAPTAPQILEMATEHGAMTTGFGGRTGVLAAGKLADLVVLDWEAIAAPYLAPEVPVVDAVLYRGRPSAVRMVVVGGRAVYRDGRFTLVDREAALGELAASLHVPVSADQRKRARLAAALVPMVREFLRGWKTDEAEPFYRYNARR